MFLLRQRNRMHMFHKLCCLSITYEIIDSRNKKRKSMLSKRLLERRKVLASFYICLVGYKLKLGISYCSFFCVDTSCELPKAYSHRYVEACWYNWWMKRGYFTPEYDKVIFDITGLTQLRAVCIAVFAQWCFDKLCWLCFCLL